MVLCYCTLLTWMCYSSNPQITYRRGRSKRAGLIATILRENLRQGGREERSPPSYPEMRGPPLHAWGEGRVVATPGDPRSLSLLIPLWAGRAPSPDRTHIPHQDGSAVSELGSTNYGSVASCFPARFVLFLLFPYISAGENLFYFLLFQIS